MKKRFSGPQIVAKLRQADVLIGQGKAVPEVCWECSPPYALPARLGCSDGEKETLNSPYSLDLTRKRAIMYLFECLFEREDYDIEKVLDFGGGSRDLFGRDFGSQDSPLYIARR